MENTDDEITGSKASISGDLLGFEVGEIVEAAREIPTGFMLAGIASEEGTRLRILGPSGNSLHPISVCKESDRFYALAVSLGDIRRPNVQADLPAMVDSASRKDVNAG